MRPHTVIHPLHVERETTLLCSLRFQTRCPALSPASWGLPLSDDRNEQASVSRLRSMHDEGHVAELGEGLRSSSRLQHARGGAADAVIEDTRFHVDGFHHPVLHHHRIAL